MSEPLHRVGDAERDHSGWDLFLLWAGAGIALPEIWAGGLIVKLGLLAGAAAIVLGHLIGNSVLAGAGWMGARHGVPAIVSTRAALGYRGSHLAALLNVVQMIGWTGFMVWVGGQSAATLPFFPSLGPKGWMIVIGLITTAWAMLGHRGWRLAQRVTVVLLLTLAVLMTIRVLNAYPLAQLLQAPRDPGVGFWQGLDAVVVMPISWLPLVADYTRYAKSPARGTAGTWLGYFVGSTWMYLVGLCAALATGSATPDAMVIKLLADTGWVGPAVAIVLFSTLTTTFLNIFSNAVSVQSLWPRAPGRMLVVAGGLLGTVLALSVDGLLYEPFLIFIGSAFCPLFGIVLTDYFLLRRGRLDAEALFRPDGYRYWHGFNPVAMLVWVLGFAFYQAATRLGWPCGAALPALGASGLLYLILMRATTRSTSTS
jgi:putative hydroxymethylpyrimidine transporter CytX